MKVKMLIHTSWGKDASSVKPIKPNDMLDIADGLAEQWINLGYCEKIVDKSTKKAKKAVERKVEKTVGIVSEDTDVKVKKSTKSTKRYKKVK